jgi:formylglycine-generating enzyme required for sulfatase activity
LKRLIEIINDDQVTRLDETDLPLMVGPNAEAHIRIGKGEQELAYVGESRGHLFLQPVEGNPAIYHNDEYVSSSVWLKSGDTTRVGEIRLSWQLSGQRLEVHITRVSAVNLQPPPTDPEQQAADDNKLLKQEKMTPVPKRYQANRRMRGIIIGAFVALLIGASFVLLAKPLSIQITPAPEQVDITGLPPVIELGDSYLGLIGRYQVRAVKQGYKELVKEVEITRRGSRYDFTMEKLPGVIDVTTDPAGATLLIDGERIGTTPQIKTELAFGSRRLRLEHPRYLPAERVIESAGLGEHQKLHLVLEPAWAVYTLQTEPPGATVAVDGKEFGQTPLAVELIAGQRQLHFTMERFSPLEVEVTVAAGQDVAPETYRLTPAPATIVIDSEPSAATVSADGSYLGRTPLTTTLPSGKAIGLRVTTAGYHANERSLTLEPAEQRQLKLKLKPEFGALFINSTPPDATLTIDDKQQKSSNGRFRLPTRPHTLRLQAAGYETLTRTVTPQAGFSQKIELVLSRKGRQEATTSAAQKSKTVTALDQKLVLVKPLPFIMGAARNEPGRRANESERKIILQRSFYISAKEVTNAEFHRFRKQHASGMAGNRSLEIDSHPVVNVSWDDATRFMNWLSQQDGLPPFYREIDGEMVATAEKGIGYRLPSEAEWAYSARLAGRQERARYAWPGKYPPTTKQGNYADESARHLLPVVIDGYEDGFAASAPVGSFVANPVGIYDLDGNVADRREAIIT